MGKNGGAYQGDEEVKPLFSFFVVGSHNPALFRISNRDTGMF